MDKEIILDVIRNHLLADEFDKLNVESFIYSEVLGSKMLSLYEMRNENLIKNGKYSKEFEDLITGLNRFRNSKELILLVSFNLEPLYMCFIDKINKTVIADILNNPPNS